MILDKSVRILIVDDYRTMRRIVRNLLDQLGFHHVDEAEDGESALAKLQTGSYGLVISDWNMAPMDGLELLQQVRADPALRTIRFIMVTAQSRAERVAAATEAGVDGYIIKPFNAEDLDQQIARVVGA
jgi:two-component system chemotaxis response regulator CheY